MGLNYDMILIFRNVSKFHYNGEFGNTLNATTLSYLIKLLNSTTWYNLEKVIKFVYVLNFSSYSLHGVGNVLNALIVGKCWYKTL